MRIWVHKWKQFAVNVLDVPSDLVWDKPRITMIGNERCFIENIRGILFFSHEKVSLEINQGHLDIKGQELIICSLSHAEVQVKGKVHQVTYFTN